VLHGEVGELLERRQLVAVVAGRVGEAQREDVASRKALNGADAPAM
jgi:hypothetical protein